MKGRRGKYNRTREQRRLLIAFLAPWMIGICVFTAYPVLATLYYSFTDYNIFQPPQWVGLANYARMFSDKNFYTSLYNSFYYMIFGIGAQLIFSLTAAMLLNMDVKGRGLFRTVYYIPSLVPPVAAALVWAWIFNPDVGLANSFLGSLGLPQPMWFSSAEWSKPGLIIMMLWSVGPTMVVFLAGLGNIPKEYYEALVIDGGGPWKKFRHITWPMLSPVILFQTINGVIGGLNMFTQSYVVSQTSQGASPGSMGGVNDSMLFYAVNFYREGFYNLKFGYASAMAWFMLLIVLALTVLLMKSSNKWVYYEGGD